GLKLKPSPVKNWIWRTLEGGVPVGTVCFALQTKQMLGTLADLTSMKTLMACMTVPLDRLPSWRLCWTSPHYFWKTICLGAGSLATSEEESAKGDDRIWWDAMLLCRRARREKPNADSEHIVKVQDFCARIGRDHAEDIRTDQQELIRSFYTDLVENEPEASKEGCPIDVILLDAVRFLFQVWFQCQLRHQLSPWQLFAKAKGGDITALEKLLALDHQVGSMPELNDVVHQRLMRKYTEAQIAVMQFDVSAAHLMALGASWVKEVSAQIRDLSRLVLPKARVKMLTYHDSYELFGGSRDGFDAFRKMANRLSGTFPMDVWDILKPQIVPQ
ncbi:MAG: hypothetical protein KDA88_24820, partial [Planctomycetaceae bacterium]|nr:hypothetical protein [Planctomycetaceae bacterium]